MVAGKKTKSAKGKAAAKTKKKDKGQIRRSDGKAHQVAVTEGQLQAGNEDQASGEDQTSGEDQASVEDQT
jgi:hypothetical protein